MTPTNTESIARNLLRFFILIILEAGIFVGIASALLLENVLRMFLVALLLITAISCGVIILGRKHDLGKEVYENGARGIAKIFILVVFVAGINAGIAAELLTGVSVVMLVMVLFGVLALMGVVLFKDFLLGEWWGK
jgi:hypothetical protein